MTEKMENATKMLEALKNLTKEDLDLFIWYLYTGVANDFEPIPQGDIKGANRQDVVTHMINQFTTDAGEITVKVLRKMNQNYIADRLESKLQEGEQQKDTRNAPVPVESLLAQSDGKQRRMTPSSKEFKKKTLQELGDKIYRPATSQKKRPALLITNIEFDYEEYNRIGAETDEKNMEGLLTALGYHVVKHKNLSAEKIDEEVKEFSKLLSDHRDSDSTFVVIMSHGARIDNRDVVLGVHYHEKLNPRDVYYVDKTFSHLNSKSCPALIDKPKVILIQACRGGHPGGEEVHDHLPKTDFWVHREKDFVCFMSTLPDTAAYRNTKTGSHFINYIVEVFCEYAHKHDLLELFTMVSDRMATRPGRTKDKLLPCLERTSLTKKFYLFPGL